MKSQPKPNVRGLFDGNDYGPANPEREREYASWAKENAFLLCPFSFILRFTVRTRRDIDSLESRLGLRYPGGLSVYIARPARSIHFVTR